MTLDEYKALQEKVRGMCVFLWLRVGGCVHACVWVEHVEDIRH